MESRVYKLVRIRKYLRKKYNLSDNDLNTYLIVKYHLDHYPTRQEIIKLGHLMIY